MEKNREPSPAPVSMLQCSSGYLNEYVTEP